MDEKIKWYACKRDIGITLFLMFFGYFSWPWLIEGTVDSSLAVYVYVLILVLIECILICQRHFWIWTGIALYGITVACDLTSYSLSYLTSNIRHVAMTELSILFGCLVFFPVVVPMSIVIYKLKKKSSRMSAYLLLWPIGWLTGIIFANRHYRLGEESIVSLASNMSFLLPILSLLIFIIAVKSHDKTMDIKRRHFWKWLSILSWLFAGIVPGLIFFGAKYSLFATVLPVIAIYNFFGFSDSKTDE